MITTKKPNTSDYTQVGFIEAKDDQGNYQNIDHIYDSEGNIVFQQGYLNEYDGANDFSIPAIGKPLIDYTIYGNTFQNGIPTPDNPIMPQGCGDLETVGIKAGQYKIPISSANTTTPIYLGEVETTRKIKKLVLTGEEKTWESHAASGMYRLTVNGYIRVLNVQIGLSTHFSGGNPIEAVPSTSPVGTFYFLVSSSGNNYVYFAPDEQPTLVGWKDYLSQQYAAGTPVTVWYVLATEETAVVNEPLMKIGDYADTVSMEQAGVQIPTLKRPNSTEIDITTSLPPSEVYAKYRGSKTHI